MSTNPSVVVGGGAAGFFSAIACAAADTQHPPILLEKGSQLLSKVRISGGGRCNVTHACFDPKQLITFYPRGAKALRGPFSRFQPRDTIQWFAERGVPLKTEEDGRMFPVTDSSQTIIDCLLQAAEKSGIEVRCQSGLEGIELYNQRFHLHLAGDRAIECQQLLLATGSNRLVWQFVEKLGHTIEPPVPSLFTFNVPTSPLKELAGISVERTKLRLEGSSLMQEGPLLITHWGFSGPAILRLSAFGARWLHASDYRATLHINWLPNVSAEELNTQLVAIRQQSPSRSLKSESPFPLPRNLWRALLARDEIPLSQRWADTSNRQLAQIKARVHDDSYAIEGKTTYKEEFVTCGGICLDEVNLKTMESRRLPGLYFAGEILDIDGITGGFNFQAAWTTGYLAGTAIGQKQLANSTYSSN